MARYAGRGGQTSIREPSEHMRRGAVQAGVNVQVTYGPRKTDRVGAGRPYAGGGRRLGV